MAPFQQPQPGKYLKLPGEENLEKSYFRYSPTMWGGSTCSGPHVDPRIASALNSGSKFEVIEISITNWRIKYKLQIAGCHQELETCYQDLRSIHVKMHWLGPESFTMNDSTGFSITIQPTRPQFVALDLWVGIVMNLLRHYSSLQKIEDAIELINKINISTLQCPDDFLSIKGSDFHSAILAYGITLPANSTPYINLDALKRLYPGCFKSINKGIQQKQSPSEQGNRINSADLVNIPQFKFQYISDICDITGKTWSEVVSAAKSIDCVEPFDRQAANKLSYILVKEPEIIRVYERKYGLTSDSQRIIASKAPSQYFKVSSTDSTATVNGATLIQKFVSNDFRKSPIFTPSQANIPDGFNPFGIDTEDLKYALDNPHISFRSFFNDLELIKDGHWVEATLFTPAFDEDLWAKMVTEYHRFTLTDLRGQERELVKNAEQKGMRWGALFGLLINAPMAPFAAIAGSNLTKMYANSKIDGARLEEFLPNPMLLFERDEGSFTKLRQSYIGVGSKRRVCLRQVFRQDNKTYFDVFPMIMFDRLATPAQVFKWEENYFLRPISASFDPSDNTVKAGLGYDPITIRRSYCYHPQFDILPPPVVMNTSIKGDHFERQPHIFKAVLREDSSFTHFYFDYPKDGVF